jgi:hypothetical protein
MNIDLHLPIWGIEHVAAALQLSIDNAREYTSSPGFAAGKKPFKRNLWVREDVLTWFAQLPDRDLCPAATSKKRGTATNRPLGGGGAARPGATPKRIKAYAPRSSK